MPSHRPALALGALVAVQAAHSVEEYVGRLWETLAPARFVAGLVSSDLPFGFAVANGVLVAFGVWCALWPVRYRWSFAAPLAWLWVVVEALNACAHVLRALLSRAYEPGLFTAPLLLLLTLSLARQLRRPDPSNPGV